MPNRIIKESICTSEKLAELTDFEFRLWVGLIVSVDDYGRGDARAKIIKGRVFPLRERVTVKEIDAAINSLAAKGCISLYDVDGKSYFWFPTWASHQRIQTKKSKFPEPENGIPRKSTVSHRESPPESNPIQSESESNPNPKESVPRKRFTPPAREELEQFILENGLNVDPQAFLDYYESNGWKVGNNPMKDWKAAARSWSRRESARPGGGKKVPAGGAGQSPLGELEQEAVRRMLGKG